LNFLFVGSSRIECGISPQDFLEPYKNSGINVNAVNIGIEGGNSYTGLMLAKMNPKKYDYLVIEVFPGDPLAYNSSLLEKNHPDRAISMFFSYYLGKYLVLQNSYSLLLYAINRSPIYYRDCQENGFVEIRHGNNKIALQKTKQKNKAFVEYIAHDDRSFAGNYVLFCSHIKHLLKNSKPNIIFLIMPVDGKIAEYQDYYFRKENPIYLLKKYFPNSIILSSGENNVLAKFHTFEDSHMDGLTAKLFSKELSKIILYKESLKK
jgi:hypothetical protein